MLTLTLLLLSPVTGSSSSRRTSLDKDHDASNKNNRALSRKSSNRINAGDTKCSRETWSIVSPNTSWTNHPFHPQVWYHTLEDIHGLWKENYFDYVLDIRPLNDNGVLEGWESFHIPGSYPINVYPANTPTEEVEMLVDFTSTNVCKDSRIFVHCWTGISGNRVAKTLIELGFTNVHAAGPQGSAGVWDWKTAGYELTYNDTFMPNNVPSCMNTCRVPLKCW